MQAVDPDTGFHIKIQLPEWNIVSELKIGV
jgi:hypothetical protein